MCYCSKEKTLLNKDPWSLQRKFKDEHRVDLVGTGVLEQGEGPISSPAYWCLESVFLMRYILMNKYFT